MTGFAQVRRRRLLLIARLPRRGGDKRVDGRPEQFVRRAAHRRSGLDRLACDHVDKCLFAGLFLRGFGGGYGCGFGTGAKVGLLDSRIAGKLFRAVLMNHMGVFQQVAAIGDREALFGVLFHQQDADAGFPDCG